MNVCDMILMTIRIYLVRCSFSFLFGLSQLRYLYIFFEVVFFCLSFPLGFVVVILSIHTVDHWVVFDTIYIHSGTPFLITVISIVYAICTMAFLDYESVSLVSLDLDLYSKFESWKFACFLFSERQVHYGTMAATLLNRHEISFHSRKSSY